MDEFWATRTGRWRLRLQGNRDGTLEQRLYRLIRDDIDRRLLPAGAIMPSARRVATELDVDESAVSEAYHALQADGLLVDRPGMGLCIASQDPAESSPGDATQIRFEKNLLATARRAARRGMSAKDVSARLPASPARRESDED